MPHRLAPELVTRFVQFLERDLGLHYPPDRQHDLIEDLLHSLKFQKDQELAEYMKRMVSDTSYKKAHLDALSEVLTIGETYYFRIGCGFEELQNTILPKLIAEKEKTDRTLRIWSAGCCTGDEPYSIAILLDKMLSLQKGWNVHILGTDVNKKFLKKAESGIFRPWSFRNTTDDIISTYFIKKKAGDYELIPRIRSMVTFFYLNLVEDFYPSLENGTNGLDIILCNNTLMYFSGPQIKKVTKKLVHCLLENRYLIVTAVEASFIKDSRLSKSNIVNVFMKGPAKPIVEKKKILPPKKARRPPLPTAPAAVKPIPTPTPISVTSMYEEGEYEACIEKLKDKKLDDEQHAILIRSYANLGNLLEAENLCRTKLSENTLTPIFHFLLANILQERNQSDDAILELKRALFLDSNYIMAHFSLAYLLHIQHKEKESRVHRRVVLEALSSYEKDVIVPGSEYIYVGRLKEMTINMGEI